MSFEPITFKYTPPPTIAGPATVVPQPVNTTPVSTSSQYGSSIANNSNAAKLATQLSNLMETAQYLQSIIKALNPNLSVTFNLSSNPDLSRSLSRIYGTTNPPSTITLDMYSNLLDADINAMRFAILNPSDSSIQLNPLQGADIASAVSAFEASLINSGEYNQTMPILMNSLAGDQLIFDQWQSALNTYPILSSLQSTPLQSTTTSPPGLDARSLNGSSVDVSTELASIMGDLLSKWSMSYAGIYNLVATPDLIESGLPSVISVLYNQPTSDLTRISCLLSTLPAILHQPQIKQSATSVDNSVTPRLLSETVAHIIQMDYYNQVAVTPASSLTGSLGTLMGITGSVNPGQVINPGLTGTVQKSAGGLSVAPNTPSQNQVLSSLPKELLLLSATLQWAQSKSAKQNQYVGQSFQRLGLRRLNNQGDQTEWLTSMKTISTISNVVKAIISTKNNNPQPSGNVNSLNTNQTVPATGLQSVGTLISSLNSPSGSSYSIDGNSLVVTPPQIPPASTTVQSTLASGGVSQFTTSSFTEPVSLGV